MPVEAGDQLTGDGLDIVIQTNYLAPFLLTNLLQVGLDSIVIPTQLPGTLPAHQPAPGRAG